MASLRLLLTRAGYILGAIVAVVVLLAIVAFFGILFLATYRVFLRHATASQAVVLVEARAG